MAEGHDRTLIIRPLANLEEGHRYIVALRDLGFGMPGIALQVGGGFGYFHLFRSTSGEQQKGESQIKNCFFHDSGF